MIIIETKEAAYDRVFGLMDEIKEMDRKKKMVMCELEDAIYDCYESSKDGDEEYEEDPEEMNYRSGYRSNLRNMYRYRHDDVEDDSMEMRSNRGMRNMRMRRNRSIR